MVGLFKRVAEAVKPKPLSAPAQALKEAWERVVEYYPSDEDFETLAAVVLPAAAKAFQQQHESTPEALNSRIAEHIEKSRRCVRDESGMPFLSAGSFTGSLSERVNKADAWGAVREAHELLIKQEMPTREICDRLTAAVLRAEGK